MSEKGGEGDREGKRKNENLKDERGSERLFSKRKLGLGKQRQ